MRSNTIKLEEKRETLLIAHRGISGLEPENTHAAFIAAGNRSYFGVETDVHRTADGNFVILHDNRTGRVAQEDLPVEGSRYEQLRALKLKDQDGGTGRIDLRIPNLEEYIGICRHYEKVAVLELKNHMEPSDVAGICARIEAMGYLEQVIFISFDLANLQEVRKLYPQQRAQLLTERFDEQLLQVLIRNRLDLDIYYPALTQEGIEACHRAGIAVNCWTVDDPAEAKRLIGYGVDYITSNLLE